MNFTLLNSFNFFEKFWKISSKKRKISYFISLILMFMSAFAEVITLGAVLPFIGVLINPDVFLNYILVKKSLNLFSIAEDHIELFFGIIFIVSVFLSTFLKVINTWYAVMIANYAAAEIGKEAYKNLLTQQYSFYKESNSSFYISSLTKKLDAVAVCIQSLLIFISSILILITVFSAFIFSLPKIALPSIFISIICYFATMALVRKKLKKNSSLIANNQNHVIKLFNESLEGIREVIINKLAKIFYNNYFSYEYQIRKAQGINVFIATVPRYFFELIIIIIIIFLTLYLNSGEGSLQDYIPILGVLILGAQRSLPIMQQCYWAVSHITGSFSSLEDVVHILNLKQTNLRSEFNFIFKKSIVLNQVYFRYSKKEKFIINNLNINFNKNSLSAIVGRSGIGKSTLMELMMGLLYPSSGDIKIDNLQLTKDNSHLWQNDLAYVPQKIFLTDSSFQENIAFGIKTNEINQKKLIACCKEVDLDDFINSKPNKYQTNVGERGMNLSGGQLQRIGIARALYKDAKVLFLDEVTSSLDETTENKIFDLIKRLSSKVTIIMVTHKIKLANKCDNVIILQDLMNREK